MSTKGLKKWALLLTFWVALQLSPLRASDQTVSGDLTVTGTTDLQGNSLTFGTRSDNSDPGVLTLYTDGTISSLEFDAGRAAHVWKWQQNGSATLQLQMTLDNNNKLTLFDQSSTPNANIVLNPLGTSTFANSLTVNGTDNEMPNQTVVNGNSVLTASLADSRYLSSSGSGITIGSASGYKGLFGTVTGPTMGLNGGTATGPFSFAVGQGSNASGISSMAMGATTTASGPASMAMGYNTTASGYFSTAMGGNSTASGWYSTAMGYNTTASGISSTAMGNSTTAQAFSSVTMGQFNVGGGDSVSWYFADPLLELGNGTSEAPSDALLVLKNGNTTIYGGDNEMPNQALAGPNSVLTEGLADSRYLAIGGTSLAFGAGSTATGTDSIALGYFASASGNYSVAMGMGTMANGIHSAAFNDTTIAGGYDSFVIGANNVGGGDPANWVPTDPLFEIGNGVRGWGYGFNSYNTTPTDALVVYKNGNTTINGADNEMPNQTLVGANSVLTENLADSRYLSSSAGAVIIGHGSTASGNYSVALGQNTTASGSEAFANGVNSNASGISSTAIGATTTASGPASMAMGSHTTASGYVSTAMGGNSTASGDNSTAMGEATWATGQCSTAMGVNSSASGNYSTASGAGSAASGNGSTAMGMSSTASGEYSTAMGVYSNASGYVSTAMGRSSASGYYSTAMGNQTTAPAFAELTLGQYNVGGFATGGDTSWIATDPLLELGNGQRDPSTGGIITSDALVVYKNGNATLQGTLTTTTVITTAPAGDIPMYTGN